jgi:hypothetical protein
MNTPPTTPDVFRHRFATGATATATFSTDPPGVAVAWSKPPTLDILPEYFVWRATILAVFAERHGLKVIHIENYL